MAESKVNDPLEDELVHAVVADTGMQPEFARFIVRPMLARLRSTRSGGHFYVRAARPKRVYPVAKIVAVYRATNDVDRTCREFSISRRTLFRLLRTPC